MRALTPDRRDIRLETVSPGNTYFDGGVWQGTESGSPEMFTESLALNPAGRMGTLQEVADVVVFVSGPRVSRMTGANVLVDGGLSRGIQFQMGCCRRGDGSVPAPPTLRDG